MARIEALIGPVVEDMGFQLVRVRFLSGARPRLQIMAERPDGSMSIEDCAQLSRSLSALLDVEDPIRGEYVLEVSSPGLDRPLVKPEDYRRFAGHEAKVELMRPIDGRKRFRGRIGGIESNEILIEDESGARLRLPFALVDEARLVLTDALIAASLKGQKDAAGNGTGAPLGEGAAVDFDDQTKKIARAKPSRGREKRERN